MEPTVLIAELRAAFAAHADPARAAQMQRYLKTTQPMFGVGRSEMRALIRAACKAHPPADRAQWEAGLRALWAEPEREFRYAAIAWSQAFARKRFLSPEAVPLVESMIREGAWWDLVDDLAVNSVGPIVARHREAMRPVLERWIEDPDLWIRRTAILAQLKHKQDTDLPMLFDFCLRQKHDRSFWIRKAIGWALRHHAHHDPDVIRAFLAEHGAELSPLSRKEAGKHLG